MDCANLTAKSNLIPLLFGNHKRDNVMVDRCGEADPQTAKHKLNSKQATITNSITAPQDQNFGINTGTSGGLGTTKSFIFKTDGDFQDGNCAVFCKLFPIEKLDDFPKSC